MKQGGMCVKGKFCPNGFEACGHSCGKGKKNKKKKMLLLDTYAEPGAKCVVIISVIVVIISLIVCSIN